MAEIITSPSNPKVKQLLALQQKSSARRERGLFVVEGRRELQHCIDAGFIIDTIFVCPALCNDTDPTSLISSSASVVETAAASGNRSQQAGLFSNPCSPLLGGTFPSGQLRKREGPAADKSASADRPGPGTLHFAKSERDLRAAGGSGDMPPYSMGRGPAQPDVSGGWLPRNEGEQTKIFEVSKEVYSKISYREGTEGVMAEVKVPERKLEGLELPENPLVMVLESVEKPGNLGAVLRSADAAGADAVLVCDPLTDLWNPNLIRASVGAVFTVPCVTCSSQEAIDWLKARGIRILTAQLQDSSLYYDCDMTVGTALVMGTEATGLTPRWRQAADAHIRIPMLGALDSLNVSVSAAILLFEAVRQRRNG